MDLTPISDFIPAFFSITDIFYSQRLENISKATASVPYVSVVPKRALQNHLQ